MNGLAAATWAAIAVLIVLPVAIFAWFLVDAARWLRAHPRRRSRRRDASRHGS